MSIARPDSIRPASPFARAARALALAAGFCALAGVASAQSFTGVGYFTGAIESFARDASATGAAVVGHGFIPTANSPTTGFRPLGWTPAGGPVNLGTLPGGTYATTRGVSADGSVVAGWSGTPVGSLEYTHACLWTGAGMLDLGTLGGNNSSAYGLSGDGSVVVGYSYTSSSQQRAFRWTQAGGMANLGVLSGKGWSASTAYGVSSNGQVVVGVCEKNQADSGRAFRWTQSGGMQNLGTLSRGDFSEAWAASANGAVVVGTSDSRNGPRAFRWSGNPMVDLGTIPGQPFSYARDVSGDGLMVVGFCSDGTTGALPVSGSIVPLTARAFLWTPAGMVDLNTYLPTLGINLAGWTLTEARGISADGTTIVGWGWHNGQPEGWVARLVP